MSAQRTAETSRGTLPTDLPAWLAAIVPALKTRWIDYFSRSASNQRTPDFNTWINLLHTAAGSPWQITEQLDRLLAAPRSSLELQNSWVRLAKLFAITFEAAQAEAAHLDAMAWQHLLQAQNRVLQQAAQVSLIRPERPDTATLTRRALYLQSITDLNRKIVNIWDPVELLDEVVRVIQKHLGYDYVSLFYLDQASQTLTLQSAIWKGQRPKPQNFLELKVGTQSIISRVAATGRPALVNEVAQDPHYRPHPALPNIKSELAVPLLVGNNLVGVLDLESEQLNAFTEDDLQIGQALADHVAVALENARLQSAVQRHLREKTLLYESNLALGANLEMDTVLNLMTRKIAEALEAGACVICQVDHKANTITALAQYVFRYPGNPARTWRPLNEPVHLSKDLAAQQVLKTMRPVVGRGHPKKPVRSWIWSLNLSQGQAEIGRKPGWGVVLALPLEMDETIIGLIEIYDKNPNRDFSADDIQLFRILAKQTSLAMEQARLLSETRQRLSEVATLYTIAQEFTSNLDLETVLDTIVTTIRRAIGCRGCCIFLLDPSGQQLEIKAADGLKPHWRKMAKLKLGEGVAGKAAAERRTVYVPDTYKDPNFIFFDEEVHSVMTIPVFAQGEVIGTINVDDNRPNAFGSSEERLLTIAATQAGTAIENARLFAKVSREQQHTQAIIQHMADGLLLIDSQGLIITCNQALAEMLGLHPGQIINEKVTSPALPPQLAAILTSPTDPARTGVLAREVTLHTPRFRTLKVFSTPVIDDERQPIGEVRVVHDITKERELEQLKDDFFSTISHELRTPLFSIQGFAKILLEEKDLDAETQTEFLGTIQRQAMQLSEMVNNLLDLSRIDEGKLDLHQEPVILEDLIHQTLLKLQGFAHQRKVNLTSNLPAILPGIMADKQRVEQVLTNLIGNAIKFTGAGGQVVVSAWQIDAEVHVQVQDNGIGISPEDLEQIFSRYYQGDNKSERSAMGSGLGLHIAKKIVEGHGGRIWAESASGQGSTFHFMLPLAPSKT
ncbi:MAG: GAF domain-containing protein [Chloroflexota bacterium]